MKNIKILLLLTVASFSINSFAMTGRNAQKLALNFGGIVAANMAVNIAYAEGQNKPEHAPDYIDSVKYPTWAKFVQQHRCSPEIEKLVKENPKKTRVQGFDYKTVYKYDAIPFYNKGEDFGRIIYAKLMKETIKENELDHINVPDKCVCHMYGTTWNVIVKEAQKEKEPSKISLIELQQLVKLVEKTGYWDIHDKNVFKINDKILSIIDTEWFVSSTDNKHIIKQVFHDMLIGCLPRQAFFSTLHMTPEAIEWLEEKIKKSTDINPNILDKIDDIMFEYNIFWRLYKLFIFPPDNRRLKEILEKEYADYKNSNNEKTKS